MKHVGAIHTLLSLLMVLLALTSCEHRPLEDPYNAHYVRVYIDENIKNVTCGFYDDTRNKPEYIRPRVLRAVLANPLSGEVVSERYLQSYGEDERGYYIDGYIAAAAGEYNLMVYNFGSPKTKMRNEYSYSDMQAYTSPVSSAYYQYFPMMQEAIDNNAIRYCPDHLFLTTCESIKIESKTHVDTLFTAQGDYFTAQSAVKSYYIQVCIKGFEYIHSAISLLGGMAGTVAMSTATPDEQDAVNIFFDMDYANVELNRDASTKRAVLYATFNTFGKLAHEQSLFTMNFEFTRTDGSSQVETIDITSMFDDPIVKEHQWILIEQEIEIDPVEGAGGLSPGVETWGDEWADIQL